MCSALQRSEVEQPMAPAPKDICYPFAKPLKTLIRDPALWEYKGWRNYFYQDNLRRNQGMVFKLGFQSRVWLYRKYFRLYRPSGHSCNYSWSQWEASCI